MHVAVVSQLPVSSFPQHLLGDQQCSGSTQAMEGCWCKQPEPPGNAVPSTVNKARLSVFPERPISGHSAAPHYWNSEQKWTSQHSLSYSVSIQRQHLSVFVCTQRFITFRGQLPCQLHKLMRVHRHGGKEKWASCTPFMSELNNFKSTNILQSLMKRNF